MARPRGRTQPCSREDARVRLAQAEKYLELASVAATEEDDSDPAATVTVANAVLAGIAAADAACCASLGQRSRGQDHRQAEQLVAEIAPGGDEAARALSKLLALKDTAHYGMINVSSQNVKTALRKAQELIDFAREVLGR